MLKKQEFSFFKNSFPSIIISPISTYAHWRLASGYSGKQRWPRTIKCNCGWNARNVWCHEGSKSQRDRLERIGEALVISCDQAAYALVLFASQELQRSIPSKALPIEKIIDQFANVCYSLLMKVCTSTSTDSSELHPHLCWVENQPGNADLDS